MNTTEQSIEQTKQPVANHYRDCLTTAYQFTNAKHRGETFTSENLIDYHFMEYLTTEVAIPAEPRVWGSVIRQLQKDGRIEHAGFDRYKNPAGHGKPINVWRVK